MPNQWKPSTSAKIILLCGSTLLVSLLIAWIGFYKPLGNRFEYDLRELRTTKNIQPVLKRLDQHLRFLKQALKPYDEVSVRSMADRHFRIAEALLSRGDPNLYSQANPYLHQAIELYPSLRHGWPYFTLGDIAEKQSRQEPSLSEKAISYYDKVSFHDFGELALRADYHIARIKVQSGQSLSSSRVKTLNNYLRYVSANPSRDIQSFLDHSWSSSDEELFLQGFMAYLQKNKTQALPFFQSVLNMNPAHYAASYYHDQCANQHMKNLYPANGDLLTQFHAPRAFLNTDLRLLHDGRFFTDLYSAEGDQTIKLTIDYYNPYSLSSQFILNWNEEQRIAEIDQPGIEGSLIFLFPLKRGQNRLSFHLVLQKKSPVSTESWIEIKRIHASVSPGETS